MNEWKDFREETPRVGELIEWKHYQAYFCDGNTENHDTEIVMFSSEIEWIEGDIWRLV